MTKRYLKPELFIQECVLMSLENLGLEYIDIYYIHNPELQLSELSANEFYHRLSKAFEVLEGFVRDGRIRMYGIATWDEYRLDAYDPNRLPVNQSDIKRIRFVIVHNVYFYLPTFHKIRTYLPRFLPLVPMLSTRSLLGTDKQSLSVPPFPCLLSIETP
ncbi:MAG: aldo/keto reductase [Candidatus Brocadia sp.]